MKTSPAIGDVFDFSFRVSDAKIVPVLYPESDIFLSMPSVFATGYMVGLMEWACAEALRPHLDEGEGSLGVLVDVNHIAPTLPGQTVTVTVTCDKAEGRKLGWSLVARDELDVIGEGRHERAVVAWDRFNQKLDEKRNRLRGA
ncbi:MAG: thioesterase family protein [Rhodospirillaceae bacterium]|nr:thioesterase family protein [Rhodospirillales bacterium]